MSCNLYTEGILFTVIRDSTESTPYWKERIRFIAKNVGREEKENKEKRIEEIEKYSWMHCNEMFYGCQYTKKDQEIIDKMRGVRVIRPTVKTQNQFETLWNKKLYKATMIKYIRKNYDITEDEINRIVSSFKSDKAIYSAIGKYPEKGNGKNENRADERAKSVVEMLNKITPPPKIIKYLDIGCGDGSITRALGKILKLQHNNIYGTDVYEQNITDFNYIVNNSSKLPFPDNSFDLITCFVVLHHVADLPTLISEIYRVLKPNGLLFIREHDSTGPLFEVYLDFVHTLQQFLVNRELDFFDSYFSHFLSRSELNLLLRQHNLSLLFTSFYPDPNPQHIYHSLFKKISS